MGYGTGQQIVLAEPYFPKLEKGDIFLFLVTVNDFYDILRKYFGGREKVWFDISNGELRRHYPKTGFKGILRDRSIIFSKILSLIYKDTQEFENDELLKATEIFYVLIKTVADNLNNKGVNILLSYHGLTDIKNTEHQHLMSDVLDKVCTEIKLSCLPLDPFLSSKRDDYFFPDHHWNKWGHAVVGKALAKKINSIL